MAVTQDGAMTLSLFRHTVDEISHRYVPFLIYVSKNMIKYAGEGGREQSLSRATATWHVIVVLSKTYLDGTSRLIYNGGSYRMGRRSRIDGIALQGLGYFTLISFMCPRPSGAICTSHPC